MGFLVGVIVVSRIAIKEIDYVESGIDFYGLGSYYYGCVSAKNSSDSCEDLTIKNKSSIVLPRIKE